MTSAKMHTGMALKASRMECCLINAVERQIIIAENTMNTLNQGETSFSLSHAEAIPME